MRIIGSGINVTTLKLSNFNGNDRAAIGMPPTPFAPLDGFEASDFTIDCGYGSLTLLNGNRAVFVYGKNIYLHRLRIIGFGGNTTYPLYVVQPATIDSYNCVVEECLIEAPASSGSAELVLIGFTGTTNSPHAFCVARNNLLKGISGTSIVNGLTPGCGIGFIAEGNHFQDLASGITELAAMETSRDIIIRHNYLRNVTTGINYARSTQVVQRMVIHDNLMDIRNSGKGIRLVGTSTNTVYTTLIIRKNIIRNINWDATTPGTITGVEVSRAQDLVAQFNIINNYGTNQGIVRNNIGSPTVTNNINSAGTAIP